MCLPSFCAEQFKETGLQIPGSALWPEISVPGLAFVRQCRCVGHSGVLKYSWGQIFNHLMNWVIKQRCCAESRTIVCALGMLKGKRECSVSPAPK